MPVAGGDGIPPEKGHMHMGFTSYDDHALRWRDVTLECRLFSILHTEYVLNFHTAWGQCCSLVREGEGFTSWNAKSVLVPEASMLNPANKSSRFRTPPRLRPCCPKTRTTHTPLAGRSIVVATAVACMTRIEGSRACRWAKVAAGNV